MNKEPDERDDLPNKLNAWANLPHVVQSGDLRTQVQFRRSRLRARHRNLAAVALIGFVITGSWIAVRFRDNRTDRVATADIFVEPKKKQSQMPVSEANLIEVETLRRDMEKMASQIKLAQLEIDLQIQSEAITNLRRDISAASREMARDDLRNSMALNWSRQQQRP